ncbi:uncharacterized protein [Rutidosis leptorrhynchoides]|uniref:uncharacterized protein n=1 Tax=Rutidosis leptorrhynchoides TaxID=125765 RepID=UPI003A9A3B5B
MDWSHKLLSVAFLIVAASIDGTQADAMVSGYVFCDRCKDGQLSIFDYPVSGVKVTLTCNGQTEMSREESTNMLGSYIMRFDGTPDLSNCQAQVSGNVQQGSSSSCGVAVGPPQKLTRTFSMFGMEIYAVNSLLTQPLQPMSFCPRSSPSNPVTNPSPPYHEPVTPTTPPSDHAPVRSPSPPPVFRLPPMPKLPPLSPLPPMPPMPFVEASACPYQNWTMEEYQCYWRAVSPDTKVSVIFGPLAARRYGNDMTLWQGLQGRGDPYRTLLREATTSLLNSYNTLQFPFNSISVLTHMNYALMGSNRSVMLTALRFMRANSGSSGRVSCRLTACK